MSSYLTFRCESTIYAVHAETVQEVVELPALNAWPGAPRGVVGVVDYRGEVVPVLDIKTRIEGGGESPRRAQRESDQLIVVREGSQKAALLVDEALDLHQQGLLMRPLPDPLPTSLRRSAPFLGGIGGTRDRVVLLLDLEALLDFPDSEPVATVERTLSDPSPLLMRRARELAVPPLAPSNGQQRQFVVVALAGERLGVPVDEVAELTHCPPFTAVPGAPAHLLGLAYHRGGLLRLVDVRAMCGLDCSGRLPTQVVVLSGPGMPTGVVVDAIESVLALKGTGAKLALDDGWLTVLDTERLDLREPRLQLGAARDR